MYLPLSKRIKAKFRKNIYIYIMVDEIKIK